MDRQIESLLRQLEIHEKNLSRLEERKAIFGINVPVDVLNQIDYEKKAIAELKKKIEEIRWDSEVERESDRAQLQPRHPIVGKSRGRPVIIIAAFIVLVAVLVYTLATVKGGNMLNVGNAILTVIAGIALGVLGNYIYDLLRARGWLPERPSIKRVLLIVLFFVPFLCVALWPHSGFDPETDNDNNHEPVIQNISINPEIIETGQKAIITVVAIDPDGDPLTYVWAVSNGKIVEGPSQQSTVTYEAPDIPGDVVLRVVARDGKNGETEQRRNISIVMPSTAP